MDNSYQTMINKFKSNYLDYKLTGEEKYKTEYLVAEQWLRKYNETLKKVKDTNNGFIQNFVSEYAKSNEDIVKAQSQIRNAKTKGPELQDTYQTLKESNEEVVPDYSPYYTKLAVVGGLGAIVAILFSL